MDDNYADESVLLMGVLNELAKAVVRWFPAEDNKPVKNTRDNKLKGELTVVCDCCKSRETTDIVVKSGEVTKGEANGTDSKCSNGPVKPSVEKCGSQNNNCAAGKKATLNNNHDNHFGTIPSEMESVFKQISTFKNCSAGCRQASSTASTGVYVCKQCSEVCTVCGVQNGPTTILDDLKEYYLDLLRLEREAEGEITEEDLDSFE